MKKQFAYYYEPSGDGPYVYDTLDALVQEHGGGVKVYELSSKLLGTVETKLTITKPKKQKKGKKND